MLLVALPLLLRRRLATAPAHKAQWLQHEQRSTSQLQAWQSWDALLRLHRFSP
jgi:hypothetical protein